MKTTGTRVALAALGILCLSAFTAQATWTYDTGANTISDGNWTLNVKAGVKDTANLQISGYVSGGNGPLDFTTFAADTGSGKVIAEIAHGLGLCQYGLTEFIAPDMTYIAGTGIAYFGNGQTNNLSLTRIVLNENVTFGNERVFDRLTKLVSLTPTCFKKAGKITNYAFYQCSSLEGDFEFPEASSIGNQAFQGCSKISRIAVPNATSLPNNTFRDCGSLTNVLLSSTVTTVGENAFYGCSSLKDVSCGIFETATSIGASAFYNCSSLDREIELKEATSIGNSAFSGSGLTGIRAPKLVTMGSSVFRSCANLEYAEVFNPTLTAVSSYCCSDCPKLKSVTWNCPRISTWSEAMFMNCTSLSNFTFKTPLTKFAGSMFGGISGGAHIAWFGDGPEPMANLFNSLVYTGVEPTFHVMQGVNSASWLGTVAPNAATYESQYKSHKRFPGRRTMGILIPYKQFAWIVGGNYALWVTAELEDGTEAEFGKVSPAYGVHYTVESPLAVSADTGAFQVSDTMAGSISGWKLYEVADDASETFLRSGTDNRPDAFNLDPEKQYKLVWQVAPLRPVAYSVLHNCGTVTMTSGGVACASGTAFASGTEVVLSAAGCEGYVFDHWEGVPDGQSRSNPLELTVSGAIDACAVFRPGRDGGGRSVTFAGGYLSDGWREIDSRGMTELSEATLVSAVLCGKGIAKCEAQPFFVQYGDDILSAQFQYLDGTTLKCVKAEFRFANGQLHARAVYADYIVGGVLGEFDFDTRDSHAAVVATADTAEGYGIKSFGYLIGGFYWIEVCGFPGNYAEPTPAYGLCRFESVGDKQTFTCPASYSNPSELISAECTGWELKGTNGVVTTGSGCSVELAYGPETAYATLTWRWRRHWSYDSANGTISDGNWTLNVKAGVKDTANLQISGYVSGGNGPLDFTTFAADTGSGKVIAEIAHGLGLCQYGLTEFIAPDMTYIAGTGIAYYGNGQTNNLSLTRIVLNENVTFGNERVFDRLTKLVSLTPTCFKKADKITNYAFYQCSSLEGDFEFPEATLAGTQAFQGCARISSFTAPKLTTINNLAFRFCSSLTNVEVSADLSQMDNNAFGDCTSLVSFSPRIILMETIGAAFQGCTSLGGRFVLPNLVKGSQTFSGCSSLEGVEAPNLEIADSSFMYNCSSVKGVLSFSVLSNVNSTAFYGMSGITDVILPRVRVIGNQAFNFCTSLTNMVFGKSLETLYGYAIYNTASPLSIWFAGGDVPRWAGNANDPAIKTADGSRARLYVYGGSDNLSWQDRLYETRTPENVAKWKESASYPGRKTFGVLKDVPNQSVYHWVVDPRTLGLSIIVR